MDMSIERVVIRHKYWKKKDHGKAYHAAAVLRGWDEALRPTISTGLSKRWALKRSPGKNDGGDGEESLRLEYFMK
jgi:hypothetical protein